MKMYNDTQTERKTMKILLAFDKFKHSMTSEEAAEAARAGVLDAFHDRGIDMEPIITVLPAADGGEGTVQAFLSAMHGETVLCNVTPPHLLPDTEEKIAAVYAVFETDTILHPHGFAGDTIKCEKMAVMEMSAASGLGLVPDAERNPMQTSTYGTGEMIRHALDRGIRRFLLGLGGSATNDLGCGMASALGARFYDADGNRIMAPTGGDLLRIHDIDLSALDARLAECTFTACCDVDNPLCGERGAAEVYGPQKGAKPEDIAVLDRGLAHIAALLNTKYGVDISDIPGSGAAGGMGGGVIAFLSGALTRGIDAVLDAVNLTAHLACTDLLLTGEGKLDAQTVCGKTVCGILRRAKDAAVPVMVFGGCIEEEAYALYSMGAAGIFALCDRPMTAAESIEQAGVLLRRRVRGAVGCFLAGNKADM